MKPASYLRLAPEEKTKRKRRKRRLRIFRAIGRWWRKRKFYVSQNDSSQGFNENQRELTMEESSVEEAWDLSSQSSRRAESGSTSPPRTDESLGEPKLPLPNAWKPSTTRSSRRNRNVYNSPRVYQDEQSIGESLESIDSLSDSYFDDGSQVTTHTTNKSDREKLFLEHVDFLRLRTRPRKVEVVWGTVGPITEI